MNVTQDSIYAIDYKIGENFYLLGVKAKTEKEAREILQAIKDTGKYVGKVTAEVTV